MILFAFTNAFAQMRAPAQARTPNPFFSLLPIILILLIFYVLVIRPQQQKQKEHARLIAGLKKNDQVVTQGGVHGTVVNVKENTFILRVDENVRIEIEKYAVSRVVKSS